MSSRTSLGKKLRTAIGIQAFRNFASFYRGIFTDLQKACDSFPEFLPGSEILDLGCGGGEFANLLLHRYPSVHITLLDIDSDIGWAVSERFKHRVSFVPSASLSQYRLSCVQIPQYIIISDVLHHLHRNELSEFFHTLAAFIGGNPITVLIKDIEPGFFRSHLSYWADRFITQEQEVNLLHEEQVLSEIRKLWPSAQIERTDLFKRDRPNYGLVIRCNQT